MTEYMAIGRALKDRTIVIRRGADRDEALTSLFARGAIDFRSVNVFVLPGQKPEADRLMEEWV